MVQCLLVEACPGGKLVEDGEPAMADPASLPRLICFGVFEVDLRSGELHKQGLKIKLQQQPFQILTMLLERPGEVVTREELRKMLWPDDTFVDFDNSLNTGINKIREALGDSADNPRFVETLPRRGYRFIYPVAGVPSPSPAVAAVGEPPSQAAHDAQMTDQRVGEAGDAAQPARRGWGLSRFLWPGVAAAILLTLGGWYLMRRGGEAARQSVQIVPFTTSAGFETFPSFSPDGKQIAFVWNGEDGRNVDIYTKMVGTESALRLTTDPAIENSPAWSPDGRRIAFLRHSPPGAAIFMISALGGEERKLVDLKEVLPWDTGLAWSPDGKMLAVSERASEESPFRIIGVSLDTLEVVPLTSPPEGSWGDLWPAFSPDAQELAFVRFPKPFRADPEVKRLGGVARRISSEGFTYIAGLTWAGGGREVIFAGSAGRASRLWRISALGGTPEQLPGVGENAILPVVSPQGNRLAFVQRSAWQGDIWALPRFGSSGQAGSSAPLITSTRLDWNSSFSPDGKRIAFQSDRSGRLNIWVCESDGSNPIQLTDLEGETGTPRWSPDGKWIAFDSRPGDNSEIYVIRAEGGAPRRLTNHVADDVVPGWSRDGNWVYFTSDRSGEYQIWKVPAEGGEATQVTRGGGFHAIESLDGAFLYYSKWGGVSNAAGDGIWKVPVQGGQETRILDRKINWPNWDLAGGGIYFLTQSGPEEWPIERLDLGTGKVATVFIHRNSNRHYSLAVSPDERLILFGVRPWPGADLMLVENFR
jgi:Tol biopolymer transport system component/DNA-binding winged helix-turn-helix (wHTH) protein